MVIQIYKRDKTNVNIDTDLATDFVSSMTYL